MYRINGNTSTFAIGVQIVAVELIVPLPWLEWSIAVSELTQIRSVITKGYPRVLCGSSLCSSESYPACLLQWLCKYKTATWMGNSLCVAGA